jgi:hypothetical protein
MVSNTTQLHEEMDIYNQQEAHVNANVLAQAQAAQTAEHVQLGLPPLTPSSASNDHRVRLGLPPSTPSSASDNHCVSMHSLPTMLNPTHFKSMIPQFREHWKKNHTLNVCNQWALEHQEPVHHHAFHCLYE